MTDETEETEGLSTRGRFIVLCLTVLLVIMVFNLLSPDRPTVTAVRFDPAEAERIRREWQRKQDKHIKKIVLAALREHDRRG